MMARNKALGLQGDLLCTEFNTRRVSKHRLSGAGSSYALQTSVFLESDQTDFHPTDVIEDADGSLLVADTGSWYMICCPTSKVAKPDILGAIYRVQKKNPPPIKDPRGLDLDWKKPQISWLSSERPEVVKRAIEALASENNIDDLRSANARLPAVWSLHRIQGHAARSAVREFLSDESADVRAAAIHSAALWRDRGALQPLIELLASDDARLRRLAAMALGRIGDLAAVKPLLETHIEKIDPFLRHAVVYALYELGDISSLPADHPFGKQVRLMQEIDQQNVTPDVIPEIRLADVAEPDPEKVARQQKRLDELAAYLPKGNARRGSILFHNEGQIEVHHVSCQR